MTRPAPSLYRRLTWARDDALRACERLAGRPVNPSVIAIGMQKSGTSAIAALVAARVGLTAAIDLPREIRSPTFHRVRTAADLERFIARNRREFASGLVKEPNVTYLAPLLRGRFPDARLLAIVRSPADTIRSVLQRLGIPGDAADHRPARGLASPGWDVVLDGEWQGFGPCGPVTCLARRWTKCIESIEALGDDAVVVRYEDFSADKAGVIEDLVRRLGLVASDPITDLLDRPFQPSGERVDSLRAYFGANVDTIDRECAEVAARWGYTDAGLTS